MFVPQEALNWEHKTSVLVQEREEAMEVDCCRDRRMDLEYFIRICDAADGGTIIQVLGAHYIVHRQQLAKVGAEYARGVGKVVADGKYLGERRGG